MKRHFVVPRIVTGRKALAEEWTLEQVTHFSDNSIPDRPIAIAGEGNFTGDAEFEGQLGPRTCAIRKRRRGDPRVVAYRSDHKQRYQRERITPGLGDSESCRILMSRYAEPFRFGRIRCQQG